MSDYEENGVDYSVSEDSSGEYHVEGSDGSSYTVDQNAEGGYSVEGHDASGDYVAGDTDSSGNVVDAGSAHENADGSYDVNAQDQYGDQASEHVDANGNVTSASEYDSSTGTYSEADSNGDGTYNYSSN